MKKAMILLAVVLITATTWAQSPQKMSYQAVIRDGSNALVTNTLVGMQISILQSAPNGTEVYVETQTPTTNANGLVSIEIGVGNIVSGDFTAIDWSAGPYFIKTETDPTGGTSYSITGTIELISVPYALYAKTAENTTETDPVFNASASKNITTSDITNWNNKYDKIRNVTRTELDALTPVFGQIVHDNTDGVILMWNGFKWIKLGGYNDCFPQATIANAGPNQTINTSVTSIKLAANTPAEGIGTWSIFSGTGGSFDDVHNPSATFTGTPCTDYSLYWDISTVCNNSISNVIISFNETPTIANAGSDIYSPSQVTVSLNGNAPSVGTGTWSVTSGTGGTFSDVNNPNASFTGNNNTTYTLRWTITTPCGNTSFDEVYVFLGNAIGQFAYGGVIFYVDGTGNHGLVCDINDQNGPWGCAGILISGADGTAISTGAQNTLDIEAGCTTSGTAADICANLSLNGFSDWFLPSTGELTEMYNNRTLIDITAITNGGVIFNSNNTYISSSERNSSFGWSVRYSDGLTVQISKSSASQFRAVRAF